MNERLILVSNHCQWHLQVQQHVEALGFRLQAVDADEFCVSHLADVRPAAVILDDTSPGWLSSLSKLKSSPVTRRIPVIAIVTTASQRQQALDAGADFNLSPGHITTHLEDILREHARFQIAEERRQLLEECSQPLPDDALNAINLFNEGAYYRQHDLFEVLWMQETGPVRNLYRAILQTGIAYFHIQRGNWRGASKMLLRCQQWLNALPDQCRGVRIDYLRQDVQAVRAELNRIGSDANPGTFGWSLVRPVMLNNRRAAGES